MALTYVSDSATIGGTEYFLASDSTTKVDQTDDCGLQVWIDFFAMASGDEYQWTLYEKVNAGTQRAVCQGNVVGVQSMLTVIPTHLVGDGWECGVKKIAGTDRTVAWSLRKAT